MIDSALTDAFLVGFRHLKMMQNQTPPKGQKIGVLTYDFSPPIGGLGVLASMYVSRLKTLFPEDKFVVISPAKEADEHGSFFGRVRYRKSAGCPLFSLFASLSLSSLVKKYQINLLHVHSGSGGVFLLKKPQCKLVVTSHHTYSQEMKYVYSQQPLKKLWKGLMARLEKRTYELADAITCVSADTANALIQDYGISREKIVIVENPIDVPAVSGSVEKNPHTVLFVGRLEPRKGISTLLHAFAMLVEKEPAAKLRLIGSNLMGHELARMTRSLGMENHVTSLGFVADPLRFREMQSAAMLVVPSTLEGFGLVAAEAMSLGTLVIASDAPGLKSIITDGVNGLSFATGNASQMADKMQEALRDPARCQMLIQKAKVDVQTRFNLDIQTKKLHQVFAQTVARDSEQ